MIEITTANDADPEKLGGLLAAAFGERRACFLRAHGDWLHQGAQHRLAVLDGAEVVGYCAFIPARCLVEGRVEAVRWWVDLWIAPTHRRQGIERELDHLVRSHSGWTLGFPNALAAPIHANHGWGVRADYRVRMLPLALTQLKWVQGQEGVKGLAARFAARAAGWPVELLRRRFGRYRPGIARRLAKATARELSEIFLRHHDRSIATWWRDEESLSWRYLEAPYRSELSFYVGGDQDGPTLALVLRTLEAGGRRMSRVLDVFGALTDRLALRDLLRLAVRDAVRAGATQVTALSTLTVFDQELRRCGFLVSAPARVCWWSEEPGKIERFGKLTHHWTLADSDNDAGQT